MAASTCNSASSVGHCGNSWMELSKSDYAKVIFCDLYHFPDSIGCRFQITDHVHEDPCDYVGLYRVGYDNLDQCIAFKMLSETQCEEDGKLLRCVFKNEELPKSLDDKFYQFLYVTRDKEVCGASTPFEIKQIKEETDEDIVADRTEDDFLVVRSTLGERNRNLELLVEKYRLRNQQLSEELEEKKKINERAYDDKEALHQQIMGLRRHLLIAEMEIKKYKEKMKNFAKQLEAEARDKNTMQSDYNKLLEENKQLKHQIKEKDLILVYEESQQNQEKQILEEQLEDAKVMIKALEESKLLALNEVNALTKLHNESKKDLEEVQAVNAELKLKLEEEQSEIQKFKKDFQELKCANVALNLKLDDEQEEIEKLLKERALLQDQRRDLKKTVEEKNTLIQMQNEEITKLEHSVKELKKNLEEKSSLLKKPVTLRIRQQPGLKVTSAKDVRKHLISWNLKHAEKLRLRKMKEDSAIADYKSPEALQQEFSRIRQILNKGESDDLSAVFSSESPEDKEKLNLDSEPSADVASSAFNDKLEDKILNMDSEPSNDATNVTFTENTDDKILVQDRMIEELKINLVNLLESRSDKNSGKECDCPLNNEDNVKLVELFAENCNYKVQIQVMKEKLEDKAKEMEKMSDQITVLKSKFMQWDDEVSDLKAHCADLRTDIVEKENLASKLKEECIKKDAIIEYLKKEKDEILKAEAVLRVAHDDATARIREAADLYKKQYIEIAKLKKKLKKNKHLFKKEDLSPKDSFDNVGDFLVKDECITGKAKLLDENLKFPNPNVSDSDTGEHVVRPAKQVESDMKHLRIGSNGKLHFILNSDFECKSISDKENASAKKDGEVTLKMQELIEQNLAGLSSSKTECNEDFFHPVAEKLTMDDISANRDKKEIPDLQKRIEKDVMNLLTSDNDDKENTDEVVHTISCSICQEPIGISYNNSDALIMHLEIEHKQEMCPICGRLFDMTLPKKYFVYHVENHFAETD